MATYAQIMAQLQQARDETSVKSPVATAIDKLSSVMGGMQKGIYALDNAIAKQRVGNAASRNIGAADDVQQKIRTLLETKLTEDKIERERHARMMEIAESVVPQVTQAQLDAYKEQRKAYREHQKLLQGQLDAAEETARIQKESAQAVADAQLSAIKDKYGTMGSAVEGLASKAQDPLSKMLVQGLGRLVKGKEDTRNKDVATALENRKRIIDRDLNWEKEDINDVFTQRRKDVEAYARLGESTEGGIASNKYGSGNKKPNKDGGNKGRGASSVEAEVLADASPAVKEAIAGRWVPVSTDKESDIPVVTRVPVSTDKESDIPVVTRATVGEFPAGESVNDVASVNAPPKNAKFKKANTQTTSPVTPSKSGVKSGMFGSKGGFLDLGGLTSAIGGIMGSIGSLASSAIKFLGPWSLVANSLMAFDRLVPIISDGAGAIMDLTKLIMPMVVTGLIEGFGGLVEGLNSLINVLPWTTNYSKDEQTQATRKALSERYSAEAIKEAQARVDARNDSESGVYTYSTTPTEGSAFMAKERISSRLTDPLEARLIETDSAPVSNEVEMAQRESWMQSQQRQNDAVRESILALAQNPGTTPIVTTNPNLSTFPV